MKPKTLIIIVAAAGLPLMLALIGMGSWVFLDKLRTQTRARDVAVYLYRGYAATSQNDWGEAVINYSKTIKLAPTNGSAFYFRGDAYFREGEYEPAISDFTSAIRLNPNDYR